MPISISLSDWLALTGSLMMAFSPVYLFIVKADRNITSLTEIVKNIKEEQSNCPYCNRTFEVKHK